MGKDKDARAILEANGLWPGGSGVERARVMDGAEPIEPTTIDVSGRLPSRLEDTLKALGWTPPQEIDEVTQKYFNSGYEAGQRDAKPAEDWLTLDEVEIQIRDKHSIPEWSTCDFANDSADAFHLIELLIVDGPGAVRVRRKRRE